MQTRNTKTHCTEEEISPASPVVVDAAVEVDPEELITEDEEEAGAQLERDSADVGAGLGQGEKGMKEKETVEDPEISMVFDTRPKYEETKLSAGCMKIRILEMKSKEIERKKKLLELEEDENARELQAEKERLKTTLEESLNPETSD